jgi:hypothetical protein
MSLYYEWGSRKFDPVMSEFTHGQNSVLFRKVQPKPTSVFIKEPFTSSASVMVVPTLLITVLIMYSLLKSSN